MHIKREPQRKTGAKDKENEEINLCLFVIIARGLQKVKPFENWLSPSNHFSAVGWMLGERSRQNASMSK